MLDPLVERLLLDEEDEGTLDAAEIEWELTDNWALEDTLVAELDGEILLDEDETLLDEDEVECAELVDEIWLDEVP